MSQAAAGKLLAEIRDCRLCVSSLPLGPRPVLQASAQARLLIAGQAPGRKVHASGVPFDDASGARLRDWLGIDRATFYDPERVAILPMGFCYPGTGKSGDLPPRPECAPAWRARVLATMPKIALTLVVGQYAQAWHLGKDAKENLTRTVGAWASYGPHIMPLPHPSPRNNIWLAQNRWFAAELLPVLRARVAAALK